MHKTTCHSVLDSGHLGFTSDRFRLGNKSKEKQEGTMPMIY